ncbi:MAG: hypothetical protein PHE04_03305 [Bacteroidales bacterium]|nr:hypothetical protein [Bacteroidales bacterium]MDD3430975.1 hypothetical protein [Bacteroidales bacterium]MDD4361549.1 hypothetical protein [Bacteroidales bacterium]MDD4430433.1 hypothetical protein [Bacteroidales bacterium]
MSKLVNILPKVFLWLLMLLSVGAMILVFSGGVIDPGAEYKEPVYIDYLLYWIGIMVGITILITIGFGLVQFVKSLVSNTKSALLSFGSILLLAAVFVITFITSDSSQPIEIMGYEGIHNQGVWLSVVSMFTNTIGIVAGVAILLMLFGGLFRVNK